MSEGKCRNLAVVAGIVALVLGQRREVVSAIVLPVGCLKKGEVCLSN